MPRAFLVLALLVVTVVTTAVAVAAAMRDDPSPSPVSAETIRGTRIAPTPEMDRQIGRIYGDVPVYRLGRIDGQVFYRIESKRDGTCFSAGNADRFGVIKCRGTYSPPTPVVDFSIIEVDTSSNDARVVRLQGAVGHGVRSVRLVDPSGAKIVEARVINNAYCVDELPVRTAGALLALSVDGRTVQRLQYSSDR
jgi:hypothetical protein